MREPHMDVVYWFCEECFEHVSFMECEEPFVWNAVKLMSHCGLNDPGGEHGLSLVVRCVGLPSMTMGFKNSLTSVSNLLIQCPLHLALQAHLATMFSDV